jgi:hypothetical protein
MLRNNDGTGCVLLKERKTDLTDHAANELAKKAQKMLA